MDSVPKIELSLRTPSRPVGGCLVALFGPLLLLFFVRLYYAFSLLGEALMSWGREGRLRWGLNAWYDDDVDDNDDIALCLIT